MSPRRERAAAAGALRAGARGGAEPVVAMLERRGRFLTAEPFFARGRRMNVDRPRPGQRAGPGDLVLVAPTGPRAGHGRIVRRLGRPDVARDVIEALMLDRGLRRRFDPLVEREARAAAERPPHGGGTRRDLRALPTITIDPPTAKDFDDAISAERLEGGAIRIWVHIADVAAHVPPRSAVDREAYRRGTSVYVPGAVEPMLPEALSNAACSLVPHEDRLAVTVELDYDGGRVLRSAFHRSIIRSDRRLSYPDVDAIFAGRERAEEPWAAPLAAARRAADALQEAREAHGALEVDSQEPEFSFSSEGHVTALVPSQQTESHRLIEHLMIAANEAVATLLESRTIPTLYRVHERPEPLAPSQAADIVAQCALLVDQHVRRTGHGRQALTTLVLRSLKQARYSPVNLGHAGLQSTHYCHFTSPIRRYPDLVCHRALLSAVGGGEDAPRAGTLDEAAEWTSARERDAMVIERDADDVARCFLLERDMYEGGWDTVYDGEVTGLIGAGAFVTFGADYQGLLPVRRLRGDWWELNEQGTMLLGTRTGGVIRLGDPVRVAVRQVDAPRGRVDLDLVGIPES